MGDYLHLGSAVELHGMPVVVDPLERTFGIVRALAHLYDFGREIEPIVNYVAHRVARRTVHHVVLLHYLKH